MTDKDFLFKIAFAELAYATNLRSAAKEKLEKGRCYYGQRAKAPARGPAHR